MSFQLEERNFTVGIGELEKSVAYGLERDESVFAVEVAGRYLRILSVELESK